MRAETGLLLRLSERDILRGESARGGWLAETAGRCGLAETATECGLLRGGGESRRRGLAKAAGRCGLAEARWCGLTEAARRRRLTKTTRCRGLAETAAEATRALRCGCAKTSRRLRRGRAESSSGSLAKTTAKSARALCCCCTEGSRRLRRGCTKTTTRACRSAKGGWLARRCRKAARS